MIDTGISLEEKPDNKPALRQKEVALAEIIEAAEKVASSNYWKLLQVKEFDPDIELLKKRLSKERDSVEMYRLQGQIEKAEKLDLVKFIQIKRKELERIKYQLHE